MMLVGVNAKVSAAASPWPSITLTMLNNSLTQPVLVTHSGDGSGRLFIVQQSGQVLIYQSGALLPTPFLDLSTKVLSSGEQGLLGLAFPPDYENRGYFFVNYTRKPDGATVVSRFYRNLLDGNVADPTSEMVLILLDQPETNHNGGHIAFSPSDDFLYIGLGDGGGGGDPQGNSQNPASLHGKMLRIDVITLSKPLIEPPQPPLGPHKLLFPAISMDRPKPYLVPENNPFLDVEGYQEEIWALGLRNPWRFSFDTSSGDLYIGDVGQSSREEIDYQSAASSGGENYGWNITEGSLCYNAPSCDLTGLTLPIMEYDHSLGCSVTGGFVYRGTAITNLQGIYLFGDYCQGRIWGLRYTGSEWTSTELLDTTLRISSFGEDQDGNLFVLDHSGGDLYRIDESPP
jgi:glucose/arabinose dehydrogenase